MSHLNGLRLTKNVLKLIVHCRSRRAVRRKANFLTRTKKSQFRSKNAIVWAHFWLFSGDIGFSSSGFLSWLFFVPRNEVLIRIPTLFINNIIYGIFSLFFCK